MARSPWTSSIQCNCETLNWCQYTSAKHVLTQKFEVTSGACSPVDCLLPASRCHVDFGYICASSKDFGQTKTGNNVFTSYDGHNKLFFHWLWLHSIKSHVNNHKKVRSICDGSTHGGHVFVTGATYAPTPQHVDFSTHLVLSALWAFVYCILVLQMCSWRLMDFHSNTSCTITLSF